MGSAVGLPLSTARREQGRRSSRRMARLAIAFTVRQESGAVQRVTLRDQAMVEPADIMARIETRVRSSEVDTFAVARDRAKRAAFVQPRQGRLSGALWRLPMYGKPGPVRRVGCRGDDRNCRPWPS